MTSRLRTVLLFLLIFVVLLHGSTIAESEKEIIQRSRTAPYRNLVQLLDVTSTEIGFDISMFRSQGFGERKVATGDLHFPWLDGLLLPWMQQQSWAHFCFSFSN